MFIKIRVRSIEFEERNVLVEINPFLNRLNCCIRVMFMAEDFASRRITSSKALDNLVLALDNASSHSLASYQSISNCFMLWGVLDLRNR